jgi:hypothetical protein
MAEAMTGKATSMARQRLPGPIRQNAANETRLYIKEKAKAKAKGWRIDATSIDLPLLVLVVEGEVEGVSREEWRECPTGRTCLSHSRLR